MAEAKGQDLEESVQTANNRYIEAVERNFDERLVKHWKTEYERRKQLQESLAGLTVTYKVSALPAAQFAFDAEVPPFKLTAYDQERAELASSELLDLQDMAFIEVGVVQSDVAATVSGFLLCYKSGDSEDSLHHRDDFMIQVISAISKQPQQRNRISEGNSKGAWHDSHVGRPPVVVVEEEDEAAKLSKATNDCIDKTAWIPQYEKLPFMIGIAIAGDLVHFFRFNRQGSLGGDVTYNLQFPVQRAMCLRAAVNVGRYVLDVFTRELVFPGTSSLRTARAAKRSTRKKTAQEPKALAATLSKVQGIKKRKKRKKHQKSQNK